MNIVQKLSSQVDMTNFDDSETECKDPPSLIEIIQGIKKRKERRKLPPPPLIPLDKNEESLKPLVLGTFEFSHLTKETTGSSPNISNHKVSEILKCSAINCKFECQPS